MSLDDVDSSVIAEVMDHDIAACRCNMSAGSRSCARRYMGWHLRTGSSFLGKRIREKVVL